MPLHSIHASRSTARVSPDRPAVAYFTITLVVLVFIASFVFSFAAIADAAEWTGAPPWTRWLAPVFIDGAILTYTCSLAIVRHRGESPLRSLFFLYTFTGVSVAVNFAHAGAAWAWDFSRLETWFGCLIGVAAPLAALFAADEATRLVFARGDEPAAAPTEEPAVEVEPVDLAPATEPEPVEQEQATQASDVDAPHEDVHLELEQAPEAAEEEVVLEPESEVQVEVEDAADEPEQAAAMESDVEVESDGSDTVPAEFDESLAMRQVWKLDESGNLVESKELVTA